MQVSTEHLPEPPPSLNSERAAELTALTEAALQRQRRELASAVEQSLGHVPRALRGAVRRALGL